MQNISGIKVLLSLMILLLYSGCKRDIETTWDTDLAAPIAHAEMDLSDLVGDSLIVTNSDKSLNLVYNYQMSIDSIEQYLIVPDTLQEKSVTLSKLILDNRALSDTITLGEIYPLAKLLDGQTTTLPAFDQGSNTGTDIDISKQFFKQAKFKEGFIDMTLSNDLPVEAEKIVFQLINKLDQQIIIYDSFLNVMPNTSVTTTKSLAGKKIDGVLVGLVKRVKTKASDNPVLVEANKGIRLDLSIRDIELEYATAIFPSQNLLEEKQEVKYNFGPTELRFLVVKTGYLVMEVFSNVKEKLTMNYSIPHSSRNNNFNDNVKQTVVVPPAPDGGFSKVVKKFPLDHYELQLMGQFPNDRPFKQNTIYSEFTVSMDYTGIERTLSLSDSVYVRFGLVEIKPELAIGDFGKRKFTYDDREPIKAFENIKGDISLEDLKLTLWFKNAFGIEADVTVENLSGYNSRTNKGVKLLAPALDNTFILRRATNPPFTPSIYAMKFDKSNSNIKQFFENMPDKIDSKFNMVVRERGSNDYTDFIFDYSTLTANLELEMPVQFGTNGLELSQVKDFDLSGFKNYDRIKSGVLKLDILNGYPLEATCNIEFLDVSGTVITTLYENGKEQTIMPANLDGFGKATAAVPSQLFVDIPQSKMQQIKSAKQIRIKTKFNTPGGNRYKIYSNYKFGVKLKGNFIYEQGF